MRKAMMALAVASAFAGAVPVAAQSYNQDYQQQRREYREELRDARRDYREDRRDYREDLRDYRQDRREARRDWRQFRRYDYNHPAPGSRAYYANEYYRDGRYYQPRRLGVNDRVYRGNDGRYYCRRSDGTTGLIVGGVAGGVLGNVIAPGGSKTLGTVLGALGGGLIGNAVDRDNITCR